MKTRLISSLLAVGFMILVLGTSMASAETMEKKEEVDIFKRWYISFNSDIIHGYENINQFIYVTDEEGNKLEDVLLEDGYFSGTITVYPPKKGYELNKNYMLHIKKGLKGANGALLEDVIMPFITREKERETANDKGDYIKIKSIRPSTDTYSLRTGQKHEFEAEVEYGLFSAEKAQLSFDWSATGKSGHSIDGNMARIAEEMIEKGIGTVTLKGTFSPYDVSSLYRRLSLGMYTAKPFVSMSEYDSNRYILNLTARTPVMVNDEQSYPAFELLTLAPTTDFYIDFGDAKEQLWNKADTLVESIYVKRATGMIEPLTIDSVKWTAENSWYSDLQVTVKEETMLKLGDQVFVELKDNGHGSPVKVMGEVNFPTYPVDLADNADINDGDNQLTFIDHLQVGFDENAAMTTDYQEDGSIWNASMLRPVYTNTYGIQVTDVKRDGFLEATFLIKNVSDFPIMINNDQLHFTLWGGNGNNIADSRIVEGEGELKPGEEKYVTVRAYHPEARSFNISIEGDSVDYSFTEPDYHPLIKDTKPYDGDVYGTVSSLFGINQVNDIKYQVVDLDLAQGRFGQFTNDETFLVATFRIANGSDRAKKISDMQTIYTTYGTWEKRKDKVTLDTLSILNTNKGLNIPANGIIDIQVPLLYSMDPNETHAVKVTLDSGEEIIAEEIEKYFPWAE